MSIDAPSASAGELTAGESDSVGAAKAGAAGEVTGTTPCFVKDCAMRCFAAFAAPPCAHATRSLVNKLSAEHYRSGRKLTATKASTAAAEGELRDAAGTSLVLFTNMSNLIGLNRVKSD
eukprot:COSAG04_NODE_875_length_9692_cov_6.365266_10_plen_119_part_00